VRRIDVEVGRQQCAAVVLVARNGYGRLLFLANPLMLGFARMGRGEGVIFLGTPWCRLANRTRFSTLPQPAGAVERS